MDAAEDFQFNKDKIYCLYCSNETFVGKYIRAVSIRSVGYFHFIAAAEDWAVQKNVFLKADSVTEIIEFDSVGDYEEHYRWKTSKEKKRP